MLAGDFLPDRLALVFAKADGPVLIRIGEENSPTIFRHLDVAEIGPALGIDADRRAKIHVVIERAFGAKFLPPVQEAGLPRLKRALKAPIIPEIDVIRDECCEINRHDYTLFLSN